MTRIDRPWSQIKWDSPHPIVRPRPSQDLAAQRERGSDRLTAADILASVDTLATVDLPGSDLSSPRPRVDNASPLTQAQILLSAAAEVEHALLVEYLYGLWSIDDDATAVVVLKIAIQEMCHFITVQNLLLFTGAQPCFARQDQDSNPILAAYPFSLRPFTREVLEDWLLTEMPPEAMWTADQRKIMAPITAHNQGKGGRVHPVGFLYAKLYWLFLANDQPTADWPNIVEQYHFDSEHIRDFPGAGSAATLQADPDNESGWKASKDRGGIFRRIDDRDGALSALAAIASQGEGSANASVVESHFSSFVELYNTIDFSQLPAPRMPVDPFVSDQASQDPAKEAERITDPLAVSLCFLFDLRYKIMLASIRAAFARARSDAARGKFAQWAFEEMLQNIKALANIIGGLPRKQGGDASVLSAAPTFALDGFTLADEAAAIDQQLRDLLQAASAAIQAVLQLQPNTAIILALQSMQKEDAAREI